MLAKDGRVIWIHHESDVLGGHGGDRPVRQGVMLDITAQKTAEEQVMFLGRHDRLTGLPNRITFEQLLEESLDRARRHHQGLAILHIDVDSLNVVNGNLGYSAGDELLVQVAARIEAAVRDCDVVARHGGDEFLVLLCDLELPAGTTITAVQTAREVAARIQESVKAPFETEGEEFYLTLSIGASIYPLDARKGPDLLRNADDAMNRSKRQGPGGMVIQSSNGSAVLGQLSMATRLRKAVQSRQWVLHYQPIVDLADGRVWGVESLVRWQDPDHGLLLPAAFLPLAEAMGLTEELGDWVIEEALHQAGRWHADGLRIQTTFNLSPRQLKRQDLVKRILGTLESAGVEPSTCTVEVTEQAVAGGGEETDRVLGELHEAGLRIALDDFGTGHSSLSRLREFPVDILKIDRSFVCDLPRARDASEMVTAIIRLALSLGIEPIAEGIETEGQRTFLLGQGCQMGQGFLFSRPEPADVVTGLLRGVRLGASL
jgi:diguanylate cyclase (GGDEF)-like protein